MGLLGVPMFGLASGAGSRFGQLEADAHGIVQGLYGELWSVQPIAERRPNFSDIVADPVRRPFTVSAIWSGEFEIALVDDDKLGVASRRPLVTVRRSDLPFAVWTNDQWTRCKTGETFEVTKVMPDSLSGLVLAMVQCGKPLTTIGAAV